MKKRFASVALQSIAIIAIAAIIAFSPALGARQPVMADTTTTVPTVSVTGTGKITVKPTIERIDFGVLTSAATASAAQTQNDATMSNINDAGKTVSLIADNGANTVSGISFEVDDTTLEQTKLAALSLAMASARKTADVVAKAAGKTILSVQTVNVNENIFSPQPMFTANSAVATSAPAPVEAG